MNRSRSREKWNRENILMRHRAIAFLGIMSILDIHRHKTRHYHSILPENLLVAESGSFLWNLLALGDL